MTTGPLVEITANMPQSVLICATALLHVTAEPTYREFYKMSFKKYKADQLFDGYRMHDERQVLITDKDGVIQEIVDIADAGGDVQEFNGILSPGFINCHCHLELSHMKGMIPEGRGLVQFVLDVVQQRHLPDETVLEAIEKAEYEMLANGIVAAGDICNNALTIPQKIKGWIYYHNFIEVSGYNPGIVTERFQRSLGFYKEYAKYYAIPVESNSLVPHAPYSVADELWDLIINFPGNHLLTIHNQETADENEWFISKKGGLAEMYEKMNIDVSFFKPSGKSSFQTFLTRFLPNQSVILVHNVDTSEDDLLFSKLATLPDGRQVVNYRLFWCLCPNANLYISKKLPDVEMLVRYDCDIVMGTDSLASNHQLSILEEIKTIQKYYPAIGIETPLKWATSNGARALQMDKLLGSFEKGKNPGVVLIEKNLLSSRRLT